MIAHKPQAVLGPHAGMAAARGIGVPTEGPPPPPSSLQKEAFNQCRGPRTAAAGREHSRPSVGVPARCTQLDMAIAMAGQ